jgi:hypothetical protein
MLLIGSCWQLLACSYWQLLAVIGSYWQLFGSSHNYGTLLLAVTIIGSDTYMIYDQHLRYTHTHTHTSVKSFIYMIWDYMDKLKTASQVLPQTCSPRCLMRVAHEGKPTDQFRCRHPHPLRYRVDPTRHKFRPLKFEFSKECLQILEE